MNGVSERMKARAGIATVALGAAGALVVLMLALGDSIDAVTPEPSKCGAGAVETPGGLCIIRGANTQADVEAKVRDMYANPDRYPRATPEPDWSKVEQYDPPMPDPGP